MFQGLDGGFTSHRREILKEFVQGLPTFQIIQQSLERDPRSTEDGSPSEDVWVLGDYLISLLHHAYSRTCSCLLSLLPGGKSADLLEASQRQKSRSSIVLDRLCLQKALASAYG